VERQHGSEKESAAQRKQSGPQRFGTQGRPHARTEEGSPKSCAQAQVARLDTANGKAGESRRLFCIREIHLE
jgi:hypothetical protein